MGLEELKSRFNPRRTYEDAARGITIEVDGVFVRVDEALAAQKGRESFEIPTEDLLQDPSIIRSARVSTGRDTKAVDEKAAGLIGSLYEGSHETPLEGGVVFRLKVTTPICYAQPFFQLRYSHNEFSGRYSVIDGDFYTPVCAQKNPEILRVFQEAEADSRNIYKKLLEAGGAREEGRFG